MNLKQKAQQIIKKAETARREADKSEGAYEQLIKRLKAEFDCEQVEDAEDLRRDYRRKLASAEKKLEVAVAEFEDKWGESLKPF
jgi:hypothetical protein